MMWPGDAPWGGDDVTLITGAINTNAEHRLVTAGLGGSFGYPYGPIPSQIYQVLAIFSHDPIAIVRLHAGLFAAVTAFALLWLSGVMNVSPWLAPMTMLGPFFWFYCRLMWDNTFAIPIGTLLLAAYGDYLRRESRVAFFTAVSCAVALPLIHPMTLPLVVAVFAHAIFFLIARAGRQGIERQAAPFASRSPGFRPGLLKKYWLGLIVIAIVTTILSGPYFQRIAQQIGHSSTLLPPRTDALSRSNALAFPLFAGRLFCAFGFFDARGPEIGLEQNHLVVVARYISLIAYPLIWLGILMAVYRFREKMTLPAICLAAVFFQAIMDASLRISPYPHYYCGTWAAAIVLLWTGLNSLSKLKMITAVIYAASLLIATTAFALDVHKQSGGSIWYGPSLESQIKAGLVQIAR